MSAYLPFAKAVAQRQGEKITEGQLAVTLGGRPCGYFEKGVVWLRSKIDVTVMRPRIAEVFDWMTGKRKDDYTQLQIYAATIMAHHSSIDTVRAGFVWLKDRVVPPPVIFKREQLDDIWQQWENKRRIIARAHEVDYFPPKPSGLCNGWCDVKSCKFWKPKRGETIETT